VIDHLLGGEGLLLERTQVFPNRNLVLSLVGDGRSCRVLSMGKTAELMDIATELEGFVTGSNLGVDWQEIWFTFEDRHFGIAVDERHAELIEVLKRLDEILAPALGKRYSRIVWFTPPPAIVVSSEPFYKDCRSSNALRFEERAAKGLQGMAIVSTTSGQPDLLEGLQVAAREISTGKTIYALTDTHGTFELGYLPAGEFEVWTCLDGFDELRFRLVVDPGSPVDRFQLYLATSGVPGRRDVVSVE
jgi:hypothetical protein